MNMCVFIKTVYVNTVPNWLKYVYDNKEANWINISELYIFGKNAQIWTGSSLLGEPKILTYQDELLKSFRRHLSTSFYCYPSTNNQKLNFSQFSLHSTPQIFFC